MSRNTAGTYSLPSGNPVVSGTTISSTTQNATLSDFATEMTNSLDRQGRGPMLAPLALQDGSISAPSVTFQGEPASGLYRAGNTDIRISINGAEVQRWNAGATTLTGLVADSATINGNVTLAGSNPASSAAMANVVTKKNVAKAWAVLQTNGVGGVTLLDGFNIASVSNNGNFIAVNFAQAFANANWAMAGFVSDWGVVGTYGGSGSGKAAGYAHVALWTGSGAVANLSTTAREFSVVFYGQQ